MGGCRDMEGLALTPSARAGMNPARPARERVRDPDTQVRPLFLDADDDALLRRYSESRRPHPLLKLRADENNTTPAALDDGSGQALRETIAEERDLLAPLRERSAVIDTTLLRPAQLRTWIRQMVNAQAARLTLVFQSFAYKHGVPLDADFVFDARMLPNPYYIKDLQPLTGRDAPVQAYLHEQPETGELLAQIEAFLLRWLPALESDQRSYVTVAIGCTGGQHRSVYCVEQLVQRFKGRGVVLARHREQEAKG